MDAVETFFAEIQKVRKDLEAEFQPVADITTDRFRLFAVEDIARTRPLGRIQTGDTLLTIKSVTGVLEDEDGRWITVEACTDARQVDIIDSETRESVLPEERPYFVHWKIDVWDVDGRWLLGDGASETGEPCVGS